MNDHVTVYAPGSTSNLGPGFDCLGIALTGGGDRVTARRWDGNGVRITRVSDERIPLDPKHNTASLAAATVLNYTTFPGAGLSLEIDKGLPLSGGLGGSAASAVGGIVAADLLFGTSLPEHELLDAALRAEAVVAGRHADNVAPSFYGGGVLVVSMQPLRLRRFAVHDSIRFVLCAPEYGVTTARAREVLPAEVQRGDAISQASHCAALILGLQEGDPDLLRAALPADRIAIPAREPLYPGYPEARRAGVEAGAWGVVVSGAGPTLLALSDADRAEAVGQALVAGFAEAGQRATARVASVDREGARRIDTEPAGS